MGGRFIFLFWYPATASRRSACDGSPAVPRNRGLLSRPLGSHVKGQTLVSTATSPCSVTGCFLAVLRYLGLLAVDRARLHSVPLAPSPWFLVLDCWQEDARDFVAGSSSPAASTRSSRTVPRTARRCDTGSSNFQTILRPSKCPKGFHPAYCLSPGRGGARAGGRGERGILAYPPA